MNCVNILNIMCNMHCTLYNSNISVKSNICHKPRIDDENNMFKVD